MEKDNEKLFDALDLIAYVNRSSNFAMLPSDPKDERPFMLQQLSRQIKTAIQNYMEDPDNEERVSFYQLKKEAWFQVLQLGRPKGSEMEPFLVLQLQNK